MTEMKPITVEELRDSLINCLSHLPLLIKVGQYESVYLPTEIDINEGIDVEGKKFLSIYFRNINLRCDNWGC